MKQAYLFSAGRRVALALLVLLGSYSCPLVAWAQLAIINSSPSAKPGEAISLQGSFSATAKIYFQSAAGTQQLIPLTQRVGQATVQVPGSAPLGRYQLWVEEGSARSAAVAVNQAYGQHFDTPEVAPSSRFRLFGRNLQLPGSTTQVRIGPYAATVNASLSDAYTLSVTAPSTLPAGTYDVFVTNGSGETKVEQQLTAIAAGPDFFAIGLPWAAKFTAAITSNVYNVKTDARLGGRFAKGNDIDNDAPAIQNAIDVAAAAGGGIVDLPAGTYRLDGMGYILRLKSRVILRGAGRDLTTIKLVGQEVNGQAWAFLYENNPTLTGLLNLTYVNEADLSFEHPKRNMLGSATETFIKNCRFTLNESTWLELNGSNKIAFTDNIVTQGANLKLEGGHGPVRMDGCRNYYVARNTITYGVDGFNLNRTNAGVWEDNTITRDGSAVYPKGKVNHVLIVNYAENFACLNNQFQVINKAAMADREINDGETIIAEGGPNAKTFESVGTVVSASTNTVVVEQDWLNPDNNDISRAIVAIVKGKGVGQWRRVTSRVGNTLTLNQNWTVVPDTSSRYATFVWGARNWLVQRNTMSNNRRGITLYHNATTDVAIVDNTLTNNGSIDLTPFQRQLRDGDVTIGFNPIFNTQIVGNRVDCSGDTYSGAFIGAHTVQHAYRNTFGTSVIGLEVRDNKLTARLPNVPAQVDAVFPNGYLNYLEYHPNGTYIDEGIPVLLGSILQNNEAVNCEKAVYLNSGSYNTLVCNTRLTGTSTLLDDRALDNVTHASVGTSTSCENAPTSPTTLRTPENPANAVAGLDYQYYEGFWDALPNFSSLTPTTTGTVTSFDLNAVVQRNYGYTVHYTGYVTVPADGQYTFTTLSDDGSRLYIGSQLVVDNDGLHGDQERSGTIGLRAGTHAFTVDFLQNGGDQHLLVSYQVPGQSRQLIPTQALRRVGPATVVYRINAGGSAITTSRGAFAADQYAIAGSGYAQNVAIANTPDPALYQSERNGTFGYSFPVPNGSYSLVLHFAEIYWTQPGQRVFNVGVEGTTRLANYDIVAKVGPRTATTETLPVTVSDGALDLTFAASVDQAKVSAIEVVSGGVARPLSAAGVQPSTAGWDVYPNPTAGAFTVSCQAAEAQQATLTLTDALGRQVRQQVAALRVGLNQLVVPAAGLPAGIYHLTLSAPGTALRSQKVVIQP